MSIRKVSVVLSSAAAAVLFLTAAADARGLRSAAVERIHIRTRLASLDPGSPRGARFVLVRATMRNQSIRIDAGGALDPQALEVFIADETGAMQPVATMRTLGRSGHAAWLVRTARGDALPFGVPDVAFLSGRAIEVRTGAGTALYGGVIPQAPRATGVPRSVRSLRTGLAVAADLTGDDVEAELEFSRSREGDRITLELEDAAPGLALEAWLQGPDGTFAKLGDLVQDEEDGDDDDAEETEPGTEESGGEDEVPDGESEYEFVLDAAAALPFGATSLADLAGRKIEIRLASDQSVVASGFLPDVSAPDDDDEEDEDHDEDDLDDDSDASASGVAND